MNVGEWVTKRAMIDPDSDFLKEAEREDRAYTNLEFNERVNRTAHALMSIGVSRGERVCVVMLNSSEFLEIFFALAKIGAIMVPMNFRLAVPELAYIVNDVSPKVLIYTSDFADKVTEIRGQVAVPNYIRHAGEDIKGDPLLSDFVSPFPADELNVETEVDETDVLVIIYTSGTTGDPKGAMLSHRNITFIAVHNLLGYGVNRSFKSLVTAPLFHIGALGAAALPVIYAGGSLVLKRFFNASEIIKLIANEKINYMFAVPVMYQMMAEAAEWKSADFSHVKYFIAGGAPMPIPLIRAYQTEKGVGFAQGYGLTETGRLSSLPIEETIRKAGSAGKEEFHVIMRIVDKEGTDVPKGEVGEIIVRGPNVFTGYWNKPEETEKGFSDGWFLTGDMARRDDEGFIYIVGRKVEMIISSGENIYPAEVERAIQSLDQVKEAAVVGMPDPTRGEVGCAFVLLKKEKELTEERLIEGLADKIAKFKIPKKVVFVDDFPRNTSGKILKKELKKRL
ncbi:MAG: long-chain fatty acid--CoA ligase [Deltaproteobacteria bacterium]|uniref:Long-chain fatty acid--CoA ligase n=1 Tax=Candidatus Zymogenus saltonus TaxID=2844893 RepID=A0A9D8KHL4_9DELT|nr:long-chain fatty acid--CoA ligase [Candidatus Zymogenus saltonus]